jgi:hypothetical protein
MATVFQENFDNYNKRIDESAYKEQTVQTSALLLEDSKTLCPQGFNSPGKSEEQLKSSGELTITPLDYSEIKDQVGRGINPPAFVTNIEQREKLEENLDLLATVAKIDFKTLDRDGDQLIGKQELFEAANSKSLDPEVSAAAQILFDNFTDAKDLARPDQELADKQLFGTQSAKERFQSTFGGDDTVDGISQKDLSVLYMLGSKDGPQQISNGIRETEIREGLLHTGLAAAATAVTIATATATATATAGVATAPAAVPLAAICASSIYTLSTELQNAFTSFFNSGEEALRTEVERKQNLLEGWKV